MAADVFIIATPLQAKVSPCLDVGQEPTKSRPEFSEPQFCSIFAMI